jgi:hypothetical protein
MSEDIVTNNTICDDKKKSINYWPEGSWPAGSLPVQEMPPSEDNNLEIMSDIAVDENAGLEFNVDPDENVNSVCESEPDVNLDFCRILQDIDNDLVDAIELLQKNRTNIQKLVQTLK